MIYTSVSMDHSHHTNYLSNQLGNNPVSAAGYHLEDHVGMEDSVQLHHHHHHHQISYDSVWPNFPLQLHHQVPSSSSTHLHYDQFGHHDHDHHHHQLVLPGNYSNFMDQEDIQHGEDPAEEEELGAMKEMMYKIAVMQPVDIDPATIRKPKRRNVRISDDPQSVAARHRREKISEKIRILQRLVPGGTKLDTASMLDEAIRYVKFLKRQIRLLQQSSHHHSHQQCINVNAGAAGTPSASNVAALAGGGGALDWLPPAIQGSAATSSSTDTPTIRPALGFTAFGGSRERDCCFDLQS